MDIEDKILELVKEKPLLMSELEEKSERSMLDVIVAAIFLEKYELIEITPTDKGGGLVKITTRGLQLHNLPNLPEGETTGEEITELVEQRVTGKMPRFIFEIDVARKDDVEVVESYAKRALERRIISVDGHEFITVASVRKKGEKGVKKRNV